MVLNDLVTWTAILCMVGFIVWVVFVFINTMRIKNNQNQARTETSTINWNTLLDPNKGDTVGVSLRDLLAQGRVKEAVDVYKSFMGVDGFAAKEAIDEMLREMRLDNESVRDEVWKLLRAGNKAGAIEAYQTATGASLAEALAFVESHEKRRK